MTAPRLHLVTDDRVLGAADFVPRARAAVAAGGDAVALHLRGHGTPAAGLHRLALALAPAVRDAGAWLLVNDRVDVALAVARSPGAPRTGAQLGARSLPVVEARRLLGDGAPIGYSAHDAGEGAGAAVAGATFVVFGSVYPTASHPDRAPAGIEALARAARETGAPVIAIGGVTPGRVGEVVAAGAHGVAVLGGVWGAADPAASVRRYLEALAAASP